MTTKTITTCEEALKLLAAYIDHELGSNEHLAVEEHLKLCRSCCSRAEFEQHLKAELAQLRRTDVSPGFKRRIQELIGQFVRTDKPQAKWGG